MPFNGSGVFSRIYNWVTEQASSPIEIAKLDTQEADFATALSNCILRDGTGVPTAATDWNGKKITNLGTAAAGTDALSRDAGDARYPQVSSGSFTGTLTGYASPPSGTFTYYIVGNICTIIGPTTSLTGTSNANTLTLTGVPTACRPTAGSWNTFCILRDNGISAMCIALYAGGGTFSFANGLFTSNVSSWTASGTKGMLAGTFFISYPLT